MSDVSTFAYVLRLVRQDSFGRFTRTEEKTINEHFDYLKKKLDEGKLILAGRCQQGEFGIVIFRAGSKKEAESFVNNDPAVKGKVMSAEMHPFSIALNEK
jgi:uncharacterized protein YciI